MRKVYADIELVNGDDLSYVRGGYLDKKDVRRIRLKMLVNSGNIMLAINEGIQEKMQFPVVERRRAELPDGSFSECDVVGNVEVRFLNRETTCRAFVLPGDTQPLLGVINMGDMDVLIDPGRHWLVVNPAHPRLPVTRWW